MTKPISGFSRKTKEEKIQWLSDHYLSNDSESISVLERYWNDNEELQRLHDDFIENTLSNFYLPFAIAPNFLINEKLYALPLVIEESSVVAASSNSAKFWLDRGGFKSKVISTLKNGQIHIKFFGKDHDLRQFFADVKPTLINAVSTIETNMKMRGGGIKDIELINSTEALDGYYQLHCTFETLNAMGANFINSCLEEIAKTFESHTLDYSAFKKHNNCPEVIMSILSNYVPECLVRAEVNCDLEHLTTNEIDGKQFAEKFISAI